MTSALAGSFFLRKSPKFTDIAVVAREMLQLRCMNAKQVAVFCAVLSLCVSVFAQAVEKVVNEDGKVQAQVNGALVPMKAPVAFGGGIIVNTNGASKVAQGKERQLEKGQSITPDGMLHKPDGSVVPIFDHYFSKAGRVYVVKDGEAPTPLAQNITFADGSVLSPDAMLRVPGGRIQRLLDGQTLQLSGSVIPTIDTVTFKNGKVTVSKDGALIPVASSITMNDGTKVMANGTMISFDGRTTTQLKDGQTVTLPGAALRR